MFNQIVTEILNLLLSVYFFYLVFKYLKLLFCANDYTDSKIIYLVEQFLYINNSIPQLVKGLQLTFLLKRVLLFIAMCVQENLQDIKIRKVSAIYWQHQICQL